jgi:HD-like signal output (HDOD) protein
MKVPVADEAFIAGMIHDVGILVSLQIQPEQLREACDRVKRDGANFCDVEREVMGMDHQQLGAALAEQWKFPRSCQLVAGHHHKPTALADQHRLLVTLVYVADTICCKSKHGFNLTGLHQTLDDAGLHDIHMDRSLIEQTSNRLDEIVGAASALVG